MSTLSIKNIGIKLLTLTILVFSSAIFAEGDSYISEGDYFIHYKQPTPKTLDIAIRPHKEVADLAVSLKINQLTAISGGDLTPYPRQGDKTAVLFLIDVSKDKTRKRLIKKNIQQMQEILQTGKEYHQFGVATFGEKFTVVFPIGTDRDEIATKSNTIAANENETLFYQHMGKAIELLDQQQVERRVLIVFSDANGEDDTVYDHNYVIQKAEKKNIAIIGLAFPPKSIASHETRHYQKLGRLADETGGLFLKADAKGNLLQTDLTKLLETTNKGGYLSFNLTSLLESKLSGKTSAILTLRNQQQSSDIPLTLDFPAKEKNLITKQQQMIAIAVTALLLLLLLVYFIKRRKPKEEITYAYIDSLDGNERYSINKKNYKIGRNPENDLVLANRAVSSFHAQIHLGRDNVFMITNLQSMNGISINDSDKSGHSTALSEGDIITIGEVRLRFLKS